MSLPLSTATRVLLFAPHPDDETIAAGGLLQQVRAAGGEVRIVLLTDGDNNPWPQRWLERRLRIDGAARQRWGRRRREEVLAALRQLGLPSESMLPLGWPDGELTDHLRQRGAEAVANLRRILDDYRPDLVVLPALEDRHPDHGSAHVLLRQALAGHAGRPRLLAYLVHGHTAVAAPQMEVPMPAEQLAAKLAALDCYATQMALSGGRMGGLARRPERYAMLEPAPREATEPRLPWRPPAVLSPWLRLVVVDQAGVQDWRWRDAPLRRAADGAWTLQLPPPVGTRFARLQLELPSPWIFDHWGWCEL